MASDGNTHKLIVMSRVGQFRMPIPYARGLLKSQNPHTQPTGVARLRCTGMIGTALEGPGLLVPCLLCATHTRTHTHTHAEAQPKCCLQQRHAYTSEALEQVPFRNTSGATFVCTRTCRGKIKVLPMTDTDTHAYTSEALEQVPFSNTSGAMCVIVPWNKLDTCVSKWSMRTLRPKSLTYKCVKGEADIRDVSVRQFSACKHGSQNH
eukprot:1148390-Pelagomonas_calceolata.AAC.5